MTRIEGGGISIYTTKMQHKSQTETQMQHAATPIFPHPSQPLHVKWPLRIQ
jgi:hypothetical protein